MDPPMTGSAMGNCSADLPVIGKSGRIVEAVAVKPNGRSPTHNATTHTPARRNHRARRHPSNGPRLPRHNSAHPHHHVHYPRYADLHPRTDRVRHRVKVRNTTGHLSRRFLQKLPQLYTTARLAIPDDSTGNSLQCFQTHNSQLL